MVFWILFTICVILVVRGVSLSTKNLAFKNFIPVFSIIALLFHKCPSFP